MIFKLYGTFHRVDVLSVAEVAPSKALGLYLGEKRKATCFGKIFIKLQSWKNYPQMNKESQDLLEALLAGDNEGIREIYKLYLSRAANLITRNGGNADDAKDIFQEALIIIYEKASKPGFRLNSAGIYGATGCKKNQTTT